MTMVIRPASAADLPAVAGLVERYWEFESIPGFDRAKVERLLGGLLAEPSRGACWVADRDGRVLGYLLAVFMFSLEHGGLMAEIDEVFVSPAARSAGLGAALLSAAERELAARGLERLQLQLGPENSHARRFYERHAFESRRYEILDKPLRR
ncbi:MAG TPA: GNAT family N-acetyltransferase [Steroidobacteraceae bacterium]|jgi:GNAT superfamily N-acetyltransferase|nr:GNAT family N-acetyltransferase [Steroidobacteraceae bacterium]